MSKQKPPRAHHYVPVWLLGRFCDAHGLLWWRRRDWPAGKIRQSSPRSVFYENDLNTRYAADGSRDVQLEHDLADFDGKISSITDRLTEQCRRGLPPDLDEERLAFLYSYTFVQYKRPPELWEGSGGSRNARVDAILEPSPEVSRVLETKGLCLWSVPRDSALLVGSQVVLRRARDLQVALRNQTTVSRFLWHPMSFWALSTVHPGASMARCLRLKSTPSIALLRATAWPLPVQIAGPFFAP